MQQENLQCGKACSVGKPVLHQAENPCSAPSGGFTRSEILQKAGIDLGETFQQKLGTGMSLCGDYRASAGNLLQVLLPRGLPISDLPRAGIDAPNLTDCCVCNIPDVHFAITTSQLRTSLFPAF